MVCNIKQNTLIKKIHKDIDRKFDKVIYIREFSKINLTILVSIWSYNKTPFF